MEDSRHIISHFPDSSTPVALPSKPPPSPLPPLCILTTSLSMYFEDSITFHPRLLTSCLLYCAPSGYKPSDTFAPASGGSQAAANLSLLSFFLTALLTFSSNPQHPRFQQTIFLLYEKIKAIRLKFLETAPSA